MIVNYLKLSLRLLVRNPFFTLVNVIGLAIGFASFFSLWQYSTSALDPEGHHKDLDRIVRVGSIMSYNNNGETGRMTMGVSQASIPPQLKNTFPEVESYVRILEQAGFFQPDLIEKLGVRIVVEPQDRKQRDRLFKGTNIAYADRNLFEFFTIPLIYGQPETVLAEANHVALSQSSATKFFGDEDPIGEMFSLNDSITLIVSGVYEDMPKVSRLNYDMIISNEGLLTKWSNPGWGGTNNFVKLKEGVDVREFESKLSTPHLVDQYYSNTLSVCNCTFNLFAQPLRDVALSKGLVGDEAYRHPSKAILTTLQLVSIVVLVMAWANYINLTLNQLNNRMKEFGTRKVNGATAVDLIKQFVTESFIVNMLAIGLSLTLLQVLRQPLGRMFEIYVPDWRSTTLEAWIGLTAAAIGGTLVTGIYPALVCIRRKGYNLFAGKTIGNSRNSVSRLLTTIQFCAAIVLISWVSVVYLQLHHILNIDIGIDRKDIIVIEGPLLKPEGYTQKVKTLSNQISIIDKVQDVSFSRFSVSDFDGDKPGDLAVVGTDIKNGAKMNGVTENFISFFGLKLLAGRNFKHDEPGNSIIISRVAAERMGFKDPSDIIGAKLMAKSGSGFKYVETEVIGVIEDYRATPFFDYSNINTLVESGEGLSLVYLDQMFPELPPEKLSVKIDMKDVQVVMDKVESLYKKTFPGNIFEWRFLDDQINRAYADEKIARNQIFLFTVLAIGIAILGLVATMAQRISERTKEIGIRKILGAKGIQIGHLLVNSFLMQFLIAALIAIPMAHFLGNAYIQKYSDKVVIAWWFYLLPLAILVAIMFMAVITLLRKAANTNPVESLRYQ